MDFTPRIRSHSSPVPLYLPPALATLQVPQIVLWFLRSHFNFQWHSPTWCDRQHKHIYKGKQHWWTCQGLWLLLHLKVVTDKAKRADSVHCRCTEIMLVLFLSLKTRQKTKLKFFKTGISGSGGKREVKEQKKKGERRRGERRNEWQISVSEASGVSTEKTSGKYVAWGRFWISPLWKAIWPTDNPGGPAKVMIRPRLISS